MPTWVIATVASLLSVVMLALVISTGALWMMLRLAQVQRADLAVAVAELRDEVDALREDLDEADSGAGDLPGGDVLDGLDLGPGLDDLLGGLLGGDGAGDLLPDSPDDSTTSGSAFDPSAVYGAACVTPDIDGGLGGLGDLFGGMFGGDDGPTPQDTDALIDQVAEQTAELRELTWTEDVEVDLLDDEAVRARLEELTVPDDGERAALEGRQAHLATLGSLPEDTDLVTLQRELLGDAVAGFYVPETGETVVRSPGAGELPSAMDQVTLAHELGHALVDQVLGLPDHSEPPLADDLDAAMASLALTEGDASLLMNLWALEHLSLMDMMTMGFDPAIAGQEEVFATVPDVIVRELMFPYTFGLDWACDRYLEGGWAALDDAYEDLPTTTSEILFGDPVVPARPTESGPPTPQADEVYASTFGAAELLWQLQAPGGDPEAALDAASDRAALWAGGTAHAWDDDGALSAAMNLAFTSGDGYTGCDTMTDWAQAAFPDASATSPETNRGAQTTRTVLDAAGQVVAVDCLADADTDGNEHVRVAIGPTRSDVEAMLR